MDDVAFVTHLRTLNYNKLYEFYVEKRTMGAWDALRQSLQRELMAGTSESPKRHKESEKLQADIETEIRKSVGEEPVRGWIIIVA